jgi:hypothetical protein
MNTLSYSIIVWHQSKSDSQEDIIYADDEKFGEYSTKEKYSQIFDSYLTNNNFKEIDKNQNAKVYRYGKEWNFLNKDGSRDYLFCSHFTDKDLVGRLIVYRARVCNVKNCETAVQKLEAYLKERGLHLNPDDEKRWREMERKKMMRMISAISAIIVIILVIILWSNK